MLSIRFPFGFPMDSNGPPLILCGFPMVFLWFALWFSFQYSSNSFRISLQSHMISINFLLIFKWCPNGFSNGFPSGPPFVFPMSPLLVFLWFPLWCSFSFLQIPSGFLCTLMCFPFKLSFGVPLFS